MKADWGETCKEMRSGSDIYIKLLTSHAEIIALRNMYLHSTKYSIEMVTIKRTCVH